MVTEPADRSSATMNEFDNVGDDDSRREEGPPDGGYGWICVAACFTINCFTWGTVSVGLRGQKSSRQGHSGAFILCLASVYDDYSFLIVSDCTDSFFQAYGIYLSHYLAEDIFPEASTWDYAFIGGFNFSIAMLIAPIVTFLLGGSEYTR